MKLFAYALRHYDELPYLEAISRQIGFDFEWTAEYPTLDNVALAQGCQAVSVITNPVGPELIDAFLDVGVQSIATRSIGYDHIDVAYARARGMRVANAAYPPEGVANFAIMLMMMALRKVKFIQQQSALQNFDLEGKIARDISACTVGIIGTGRIGATVVRHLAGFGCKLYAYDILPSEEVAKNATYAALDDLLRACDVVTLHAPATEENFHMLGERELALLPQGAVLVNTARGSLVDSSALIAALESGHIGAAALDTIENEAGMYYLDRRGEDLNNPERDALDAMPNVVVLPHMAFYTEENVRHMVETSTQALVDFANGKTPPNEV